MKAIEVVDVIEANENFYQDGLDYYMDAVVTVNDVHTRCEQISIVQCDLDGFGRTGIHELLEIRRGNWISWIFLDEIERLTVEEYKG